MDADGCWMKITVTTCVPISMVAFRMGVKCQVDVDGGQKVRHAGFVKMSVVEIE